MEVTTLKVCFDTQSAVRIRSSLNSSGRTRHLDLILLDVKYKMRKDKRLKWSMSLTLISSAIEKIIITKQFSNY